MLLATALVARYSLGYWLNETETVPDIDVVGYVNPIVKSDLNGAASASVGWGVYVALGGGGPVGWGATVIAGGVGNSVLAALDNLW